MALPNSKELNIFFKSLESWVSIPTVCIQLYETQTEGFREKERKRIFPLGNIEGDHSAQLSGYHLHNSIAKHSYMRSF